MLSSLGSEAFALDNQVGLEDGDSCEINQNGVKIPGKVRGLECCSVSDSNVCVVILKPFPESSIRPKLKINKMLKGSEINANP
jgi:hypothetical protein